MRVKFSRVSAMRPSVSLRRSLAGDAGGFLETPQLVRFASMMREIMPWPMMA